MIPQSPEEHGVSAFSAFCPSPGLLAEEDAPTARGCHRVLSSGAGSHKMNSVRLHKSSELRDVDPPAALIKAWIPR